MMTDGSNRLAGAACMVGSACCFTLVGVLVKLAGDLVGVWQLSLYRALVGIAIMAALAAAFKVSLKGSDLKVLLIRGFTGSVGFLSIVVALRSIPLAEVMVLFYLFPAFAALFSPWLNRERLPRSRWPFLGLAFAGTSVILGVGGGIELGLGHVCALITAVMAGLSTALVRRLTGEHSPYAIFFYFCLVAAAVSMGPLLLGDEPLAPGGAGLAFLLAVGVAACIGQVLMNMGFNHLPAAEGGVVLMSQVVIAAALGVALFGEPLTGRLIIGGAMVLLAGAFLNRAARKRSAVRGRAPKPPTPGPGG